MTRSYEKTDENRRVFNMFEDDPSPVVATRLRPLADDLRIWRMPAKFQWTMLRAASLLEQASSEALARKFDCEFYEPTEWSERLAKTPTVTDEQVAFAMGRLSCCDF